MSVFGDLDDTVLSQAEQMLLSCVKMSTDVVKFPKKPQSNAYPEMRSTIDPVCDPRMVQYDLHGMMGMAVQASHAVADASVDGQFLTGCIDRMLVRRHFIKNEWEFQVILCDLTRVGPLKRLTRFGRETA